MHDDDCIIVSKNYQFIDDLLESLKNGPENFILTDEVYIENYIGVQTKPLKSDTI